ncbi:hypothetical protein CQJ94_13345 [Glycomyces fuscus]|nr:hypothetical protein CQJ94_13345 [Glycomyces fuscus]
MLRDEVGRIRDRARYLSIWGEEGLIPLQPFVVSRAATGLVHALGRNLHRLAVEHALARADGDLHRLADDVRWPESERWILHENTMLGPAVESCRTDFLVSGGVPYALEVNIGTCLNGSTSTPVLNETLLDTTVGRAVSEAHGPGAGSFLAGLAAWLRAGRGSGDGRVALVSSADASDEGSFRWAEHQIRFLASQGVTADFVPVEELDAGDGVLTWRGRRYTQAVRYFMLSGRLLQHRDAVIALEQAGDTAFYGSFLSQLFTSKAIIADLCQNEHLSADARRVVGHVPWTARLTERHALRDGHKVDPIAWAADNRERAVLKPFNLFGSRGVVVGRFVSEERWRHELERAVASEDHVVQELVRPDSWRSTYWSIAEERLVTVDNPTFIGPFTVAGADGGVFAQQPVADGWPGLPGSAAGASLGTVVGA